MVNVSLTFLCEFALDARDKKGKKGKSKKDKKSKKEKKGKKKKNVEDVVEVAKPENCIVVESIDNFLHIEYNLLPNKPSVSVDVVSWGPIAKVCVQDQTTVMKSIKTADHYWTAFTVDNSFSLNDDDVVNLKKHQITVNAYLNKSKIPDKVRNDKTREFFVAKENIVDAQLFCKAYIDEDEANAVNSTQKPDDNPRKPQDVDFYQSLHDLPIDLHKNKIFNIINKTISGDFVECLNNGIEEYVFVEKTDKKGKKGRNKSKKGGKKGKKKKDVVSMTFSAELFFTDPYKFDLGFNETNSKLPSAFVLISVSDLLTTSQIRTLNPLIVKINKIKNFPGHALLNNGFVSVYATCAIDNLFSYCIGERYISKKISFKNHQVHFLNEYDPVNYIEAIQWGNITVTIYGRKQKPKTVIPILFGNQKRDTRISKHSCKNEVQNDLLTKALGQSILVPLCVCAIKLDSFSSYSPAMILNKLEHCVHPGYTTVRLNNLETKYPIDTQNLNPITSDMLLSNETSLDIEIRINKPFKIPKSIKQCKHFYKRIVIVTYNKFVAKTVLAQVLNHNYAYLGARILIPNFHTKDYEDDPVKYVNVITGFVIDFDDLCIMFLEGLDNGILKNIWLQMKYTHKYAAKVFYNSEHIYTQRLYGDLIHYGGLYTVTLQFGFCIMLNNKNVNVKGMHSVDCKRAIQKLLVINKLNVLSQVNHEILPTIEEIKKLNKECGIPLINQKICGYDDLCPSLY